MCLAVALQWQHVERVAGSVLQSFQNCQVCTAVIETILQPRASRDLMSRETRLQLLNG